MNIPDEVIERAAEAYFLASDKDIGFDATTWEADADETTKEQFRWAVKQTGPVIAEWARKEALREAAELAENTSEMAWSVAEARVGAWLAKSIRALAEGVSDGQQ